VPGERHLFVDGVPRGAQKLTTRRQGISAGTGTQRRRHGAFARPAQAPGCLRQQTARPEVTGVAGTAHQLKVRERRFADPFGPAIARGLAAPHRQRNPLSGSATRPSFGVEVFHDQQRLAGLSCAVFSSVCVLTVISCSWQLLVFPARRRLRREPRRTERAGSPAAFVQFRFKIKHRAVLRTVPLGLFSQGRPVAAASSCKRIVVSVHVAPRRGRHAMGTPVGSVTRSPGFGRNLFD